MYRAEVYKTCDTHGPYNHVYWYWEAQFFEEFAGPAHGVIRRYITSVRYNTHKEAISRATDLIYVMIESERDRNAK
jgi:hypothetical protein